MESSLPPRHVTGASLSAPAKQPSSVFQVLALMGFAKHRIERAIAATGGRGVQLAFDWLLAHINDPLLDEDSPREYILYLCPTGALFDQISLFFDQMLQQCGWNGAHNYVPHITLVSFFKAPDSSHGQIVEGLKQVMQRLGSVCPTALKLEPYTSENFMGLFVSEADSQIFRKLAVQFIKEISDAAISPEANTKSLHITLAYQFLPEHIEKLETFLKKIDVNRDPTCWEVRLYSRDSRAAGKEVHKVIYPHVANQPDELELLSGDYIYLSSEAISRSFDGWVEGLSWLTGCSGYLPLNYVERVPESDSWTLHRSYKLSQSGDFSHAEDPDLFSPSLLMNNLHQSRGNNDAQRDQQKAAKPTPAQSKTAVHDTQENVLVSAGEAMNAESILKSTLTQQALVASLRKKSSSGMDACQNGFGCDGERNECSSLFIGNDAGVESTTSSSMPAKLCSKQIFVVRHGERVDFTFGKWIPHCFDAYGHQYMRKDLNMPRRVPQRAGGPKNFENDCPLTCIGMTQALLTGEALREAGVNFNFVICSPSLRCVQTCHYILRGMGISKDFPIHIEPGLFEWLSWFKKGLPTWLTLNELTQSGYNIQPNYEPCFKVEDVRNTDETLEEYYSRSFVVLKRVERCLETLGGNGLVVAHGASLDTCTRQITGGTVRTTKDLVSVLCRVHYCGMAVIEERSESEVATDSSGSDIRWKLKEPPIPPMTHTGNARFDWEILSGP